MKRETVTLETGAGTLETVTRESAPTGLLSGIGTGVEVLKEKSAPLVPVGKVIKLVRVSWSDLTTMERKIGVPQTKLGELLILKGVILVALAPMGMLG